MDPVSVFLRLLVMRHQADKVELVEDWNNRFKVSTTDLQYKIERNSTSLINVSRRLDLIPKYKKQFVSFSELSQDLKVIKKINRPFFYVMIGLWVG